MKKCIAIIFCWTLTSFCPNWNGSYYAHNSNPQYQSAVTYLSEFDLTQFPRILDLGCGTGNVSAYIAQCVPKSQIVGVDKSACMIKTAQQQYCSISNLSFIVQDAQHLSIPQTFDLIYSTATFHWIPNQQKALYALAHHLNPNGHLFIVMPGNVEGRKKAFYSVLYSKKWRQLIENDKKPAFVYFQDPDNLSAMIEKTGLTIISSYQKLILRTFKNREKYHSWIMGFIGGFDALKNLSPKKLSNFAYDYVDAIIQIMGINPDGSIVSPMQHTIVHAKKIID